MELKNKQLYWVKIEGETEIGRYYEKSVILDGKPIFELRGGRFIESHKVKVVKKASEKEL